MEKEILQAIKDDMLYDYITRNYQKLSPETMRDLILEIYYVARCETVEDNKECINIFKDQIVNNLIDMRDWEE